MKKAKCWESSQGERSGTGRLRAENGTPEGLGEAEWESGFAGIYEYAGEPLEEGEFLLDIREEDGEWAVVC